VRKTDSQDEQAPSIKKRGKGEKEGGRRECTGIAAGQEGRLEISTMG